MRELGKFGLWEKRMQKVLSRNQKQHLLRGEFSGICVRVGVLLESASPTPTHSWRNWVSFPNPNPNPLNVVTFKSVGESDLVSPFSQVFQSDKVSGQVLQVFIQLSWGSWLDATRRHLEPGCMLVRFPDWLESWVGLGTWLAGCPREVLGGCHYPLHHLHRTGFLCATATPGAPYSIEVTSVKNILCGGRED